MSSCVVRPVRIVSTSYPGSVRPVVSECERTHLFPTGCDCDQASPTRTLALLEVSDTRLILERSAHVAKQGILAKQLGRGSVTR